MRKTKIVATIGPASGNTETLTELIKHGFDVARLNFSHGTHQSHLEVINNIREAEKKAGRRVAIMLDTMGPEIRTGRFVEDKVQLKAGSHVILTSESVPGNQQKFSVTYQKIAQDLFPGDHVLIDDGLIDLVVTRIEGQEVHTTVLTGGEISNNKGVNLPYKKLDLPSLIDKDIRDIEFGIAQNLDFIAASFVRSAKDVQAIRAILDAHNSEIKIIAKIENAEGVENIDQILEAADGVMVARGDLGVEIPPEEVPIAQKKIIKKANLIGKPVITATQMLDSMMRNPRPTRAEASDVANAILDGTDAVMLSGETAAGKYPALAVLMMNRIALKTENEMQSTIYNLISEPVKNTVSDAIANATAKIAGNLQAAAIITSTTSGYTARMVSKYRPHAQIIAATPSKKVFRQMKLIWGVESLVTPHNHGTDEMIRTAVANALEQGLISDGDTVIVTAGIPISTKGSTNLIKVEIIGKDQI